MKEEAGMKLWSPTRAFVGLAAAGLVALLGTTAIAAENIYKNYNGLLSADPAQRPSEPDGFGAGPTLNPGGSGQLLYGGYYDVRDNDGVQINNFQILNQNTNDTEHRECDAQDFMRGVDGENCYNPLGGILAKVRFRAYKESSEVLDFVIALSCGEVWAGNLSLDGTTPVVKSKFPVVVEQDNVNGKVVTAPAFDPNNGGAAQPFVGVGQAGVADDYDQQRGYVEVFALESLYCEPDGAPGTENAGVPGAGVLNLDGGTWTRTEEQIGTNALSGQVFLVKPTVGVSYGYQMDAITRFAEVGAPGLIDGTSSLFGAEDPNTESCLVYVGGSQLTTAECRTAVSLALSKSRVFGQYDIEQITAGNTKMVVTLPGKSTYCQGFGVAIPPFQCNAYEDATFDSEGLYWGVTGGEEIACEVYDRQENFFVPGPQAGCGFISPCEEPPVDTDPCFLPYEQTIFGIMGTHEVGTGTDQQVLTGLLPHGASGWLELDLRENYGGAVIHSEVNTQQSVLGVEVEGYVGMPAIGLVLQTYENGSAGGTYGNAIPMTSNQQVIMFGQGS